MSHPGCNTYPVKHLGEVLPVPPEMIRQLWKKVRYVFRHIPGYDVQRTHTRLLVGIDRLWLGIVEGQIRGVIVTSISPRPPSKHKIFERKDAALMKSLTIHLAGGPKTVEKLRSWLPSAIERISAYAREQGCHQLFILARKGWQQHAKDWWSPDWEAMAVSRDRPTKSTCHRLSFRNRPGYWRPMVPVPAAKFARYMYGFMGTFYFKEAA